MLCWLLAGQLVPHESNPVSHSKTFSKYESKTIDIMYKLETSVVLLVVTVILIGIENAIF